MTKKTEMSTPEPVGGDNRGEIVLYQPEGEVRLEVRVENETVWLNRQQLALLFNRDIKTIGKHITNALKEECQNSKRRSHSQQAISGPRAEDNAHDS